MIKRLFVDIDGTLAVFNQISRIETLYQQGYFLNLKPMNSVLAAVRQRAAAPICTCGRRTSEKAKNPRKGVLSDER